MKNQTTAAVLVLGVATAAWADLPGLPPAQPPTDARTGEPQRPALVAQPMPVRGSLFGQAAAGAAMTAGSGYGEAQGASSPPISMIAVIPPTPKKFRKNDIVTVIIREDSAAKTDGKGDAKKTQDFDFGLDQFLQLALSSSGIPTIGSTQDSSTMPKIKFSYSNDRKSDASQERKDSLSARLSATVVDVKPNGTLVIEAVKQIAVDKEEQIFKLTGICRAEDISVDNTLLSTQLADLTLSKQTRGEVRDSTRRGWLNKFIDTFSPF